MDIDEYEHIVTEQLKAYDFAQLTNEELELGLEETEVTQEQANLLYESQNFIRVHEDYDEMVLVTRIENQSIDELKSFFECLFDMEDDQLEKESRMFVLLVAENTTKAMKTLVKRRALADYPEYLLPIIIGLDDGSYTHHEKTSFGKSLTTLYQMEQQAEKYFKVRE